MDTTILLLLLQISLILAQFIFLIVGYFLAVKQFRMSKASHFLERLLSKDMVEARSTVDKIFQGNELKTTLEYLSNPDNVSDLNNVRRFANFFQELGVAYNKKLVDKSYVIDIFDVLICKYWTRMNGWIVEYRREVDKTLYSKWEDLRDELRSKNQELKKQ